MAFIMINDLASDATSRNQITVDAIVVVISFDFLHSQPVCSVFCYCKPRVVNYGVSCFIIGFWILCHKSVRCKIVQMGFNLAKQILLYLFASNALVSFDHVKVYFINNTIVKF